MNMNPTTTLLAIPNGKEGTKQTLNIMRDLVRRGKKSPAIRQFAVMLTNGLMQKDYFGEVETIHNFIKDHIRYVRDVRNVETIQTPERTLENKAGDCDDKSTLAATLLEAIGHPTRFVAIGLHNQPYSHVFPETRVGNKWVSVETTEPVPLGWRPGNITSAMVVTN